MGLGSHLAEASAPLVDLVYPPRCPTCGDGIARHGGLCAGCWGALVVPGEPACAACGRPFAQSSAEDGSHCAPCLQSPPRHAGIHAATLYNEMSRKLVLSFKHGRKIGMAPMLARMMASKLPALADEAPLPLLVPVPLHRWRLWKRGFNQAALLARELERSGRGELCVDMLVRTKATRSLGGLGKLARRRLLAGAIAVRSDRTRVLAGRDILLVDDVLTSGATSDACVSALLKAGAASVRIACFARVLDEALDAAREFAGPQSETPEA